jgi:hypothetical protein
LKKKLAAIEADGKVQHIGERVDIEFCDKVQPPKVSTWSPGTVLLGDHVKRRSPGRRRPLHNPLAFHGLKLFASSVKLVPL